MAKKKSRIALARARQRRYRKFVGRRGSRRSQLDAIDYKDIATLQKYLSQQGKLFSRKRSGLNTQQQQELKRAVKYARFLALLPYVA